MKAGNAKLFVRNKLTNVVMEVKAVVGKSKFDNYYLNDPQKKYQKGDYVCIHRGEELILKPDQVEETEPVQDIVSTWRDDYMQLGSRTR